MIVELLCNCIKYTIETCTSSLNHCQLNIKHPLPNGLKNQMQDMRHLMTIVSNCLYTMNLWSLK